jgi:dynein heavy chain, axonemal
MVRLWTHETLRVFHDRLTDDSDRAWFGKLLVEMLEKHFKEKATKVLAIERINDEGLISGMRSLLFADFTVPGADPKMYR